MKENFQSLIPELFNYLRKKLRNAQMRTTKTAQCAIGYLKMNEATKPIVYVVSSGMAGNISQALLDSHQVIILDKIPEHPKQTDELLDYGPVFELRERSEAWDDLNKMSNNQPRNRDHGWYRQFDKSNKKRNFKK